MKSVKVECYAGSRAEEHPLRFRLDGKRFEVIKVIERWLTPGCRCFKVLAGDGCEYVLIYNAGEDTWELEVKGRPQDS